MGDFVVNFFESLGYVYFVSQCINRNEKYKLLHSYFLFIASLAILTVPSYLTHIDQISLFLINAIAFLICYWYSGNSSIEIIFLLLYVETLIIISNIFSLFLFQNIFHASISLIFSTPRLIILTSLFSKLLFCSLSFFSAKIMKKRNFALSKSLRILVIIISISFFTLAYSFTNLVSNRVDQQTYFIFLISLSVLLVLNYVLYNILKEENYKQMIKNIQYSEFENMKFFIEATKSINDENRKLKHCLENILLILKKEKQNQNIKNICLKLQNIKNNTQFIETENNVINNIFNTVMLVYKDKNIQWNLYLESSLLEIESLDLAIILDSLLKLVIENIDTNKEVVFKTREKSKFYYLSLSFYCKDKSESELYPLLLENIIRKYSGEMIIKTNNNKTYCDILLKKKKG